MKTDDLIEALAAGVEPVRPARLSPWMVAGALAVALTSVVVMLGVLPDLADVVRSAAFWAKAAYSGALAAASLWLVTRLGTPGTSIGLAGWSLAAIVGLAGVIGGIELILLPPEA
uniref:NrsF family protein n=1 Tax=uncultured Brevundimonas sp. TaxID=213418 RepID=UPI002611B463